MSFDIKSHIPTIKKMVVAAVDMLGEVVENEQVDLFITPKGNIVKKLDNNVMKPIIIYSVIDGLIFQQRCFDELLKNFEYDQKKSQLTYTGELNKTLPVFFKRKTKTKKNYGQADSQYISLKKKETESYDLQPEEVSRALKIYLRKKFTTPLEVVHGNEKFLVEWLFTEGNIMSIVRAQIKLYTYNYKTNIETSLAEKLFTNNNIILDTINFITSFEIPDIIQSNEEHLESWKKGISYTIESLSDLDDFFYCKMATENNRTAIYRLVQNKNNWYYALEISLERT